MEDSSVDIVVAGEILEHIYNSKDFVSEIRRILRPGGSLIISVSNISSLKYRAAFLLGRIPAHAAKADMTYPDGSPGHVRDYNFRELKNALVGFDIVKEATDAMLPKTLGRSAIVLAKKPIWVKRVMRKPHAPASFQKRKDLNTHLYN